MKILVGHEGPYNSANNYGAGGGGGVFVTESNNSALVVAGGGGPCGKKAMEQVQQPVEALEVGITGLGNTSFLKSWFWNNWRRREWFK